MKFNKLYLAMAAAALAACTNPVEPYDAIYMTDAQISQDKSITIDITPDGTAITVSSSVNATEDIQVELGVDAALLEGYNKSTRKTIFLLQKAATHSVQTLLSSRPDITCQKPLTSQ